MISWAIRLWADLCVLLSVYNLKIAAEAEEAIKFFRGTPFQWELMQAWDARCRALVRADVWMRRANKCDSRLERRGS